MVNKPLIRPYFLGGVALGGVARISMIFWAEKSLLVPLAVTTTCQALQKDVAPEKFLQTFQNFTKPVFPTEAKHKKIPGRHRKVPFF